jgi:TatD DNase family protein
LTTAAPYINIHTHAISLNDEFALINHNAEIRDDVPRSYFSIGIHPWKINLQSEGEQLFAILKNLTNKHLFAIGECGLDKLIDTDLKEQEKIFMAQIRIAEEIKKPIIIHCVKAFEDLVRIKKEMKVSVPMIIHGYNNNQQIAEHLIKNNFYFSFGEALFKENSNASKVISIISKEKLFLETDDKPITIQEIYAKAAGLLNIDMEQLKEIVYGNFKRVFLNRSEM